MNLENLNVVQLSTIEVSEVEGGFWGHVATGIALLGAADWIYGQVSYGWNHCQ